MSNSFQSQAEHYWVYLKWCRKENFGGLVRQSQGARTDCWNGSNSKQHFFLHNLFELQPTPSHPWSKDYVFAGVELSSWIWQPHTSLMTEWGVAKNLILGIFVLFFMFFFACFLCCHWASVSLDFLSCPVRVRAAMSEQVSETLPPIPMAVQYQTLQSLFWGEKGSDGQTPCGTGLESRCSVCAEQESPGQPLLCQLWGVCRVVEYRDVFSGGGEMQQDTLFSKITFLPNPIRRITRVDL